MFPCLDDPGPGREKSPSSTLRTRPSLVARRRQKWGWVVREGGLRLICPLGDVDAEAQERRRSAVPSKRFGGSSAGRQVRRASAGFSGFGASVENARGTPQGSRPRPPGGTACARSGAASPQERTDDPCQREDGLRRGFLPEHPTHPLLEVGVGQQAVAAWLHTGKRVAVEQEDVIPSRSQVAAAAAPAEPSPTTAASHTLQGASDAGTWKSTAGLARHLHPRSAAIPRSL